MQDIDTVVIGAGQAGLATSHELKQRGVDHVVLEKGRIGQGWRDRWDSFCLVTPNWSVNLPGFPYDGDDPDGFMPRDEIVAYLERYAESFDAPVRTGISIASVAGGEGSGFAIGTDGEEFQCRNLVLATGAFQKPLRPSGAESLPDTVRCMDLGDFTSEADLPPGDVLIVGSGQSGCQIAEDPPTEIDLTSFGTVLFTGGFRPDFSSWLPWSEAFDGDGFPLQSDGASTVIDGLFFVGVHFMRKRKSALLYGVGEDAGVVSDAIAAR